MSNSQINRNFGKCYALVNGERCGCQRFIIVNDSKMCEVCNHHYGYHEDKEDDNKSNNNGQRVPTTLDEFYSRHNNSNVLSNQETDASLSSNSILNQLLSGRALEEHSIANELNRTFTQNQFAASTEIRASNNNQGVFNPSLGFSNYSLQQRGKRRRHLETKEPKFKEMCISVIVLPEVGQQIKIPTVLQPRYSKLFFIY